jgi:hypothetical protein
MRGEVSLRRNRVIVLSVAGAERQRNPAFVRGTANWLQSFWPRIQLCEVAPLELLPPGRIMIEPLSQLRAGGGIFYPGVKMQSFFPDSTRPESFDQKARTIF